MLVTTYQISVSQSPAWLAQELNSTRLQADKVEKHCITPCKNGLGILWFSVLQDSSHCLSMLYEPSHHIELKYGLLGHHCL